MIAASTLTYRTIDLATDADQAVQHYHDACIATFGNDSNYPGDRWYLRTLARKIEEFPDGQLLAYQDKYCVGQLELEVPYGKPNGYVSLFYVTPPFRGRGYGRVLNDRAERYFRSWEATRIDLHVSRRNNIAMGFYRAMGYKVTSVNATESGLWKMTKVLR